MFIDHSLRFQNQIIAPVRLPLVPSTRLHWKKLYLCFTVCHAIIYSSRSTVTLCARISAHVWKHVSTATLWKENYFSKTPAVFQTANYIQFVCFFICLFCKMHKSWRRIITLSFMVELRNWAGYSCAFFQPFLFDKGHKHSWPLK